MVKYYAQNILGIEKPKLTLGASLEMLEIKTRGKLHSATSDTQNTYILNEKLKKNGVDRLPYIKRIAVETETNENE
jgi:hypothetical protein